MSDHKSFLDPEVRAAWAELKRLDLPEFRLVFMDTPGYDPVWQEVDQCPFKPA